MTRKYPLETNANHFPCPRVTPRAKSATPRARTSPTRRSTTRASGSARPKSPWYASRGPIPVLVLSNSNLLRLQRRGAGKRQHVSVFLFTDCAPHRGVQGPQLQQPPGLSRLPLIHMTFAPAFVAACIFMLAPANRHASRKPRSGVNLFLCLLLTRVCGCTSVGRGPRCLRVGCAGWHRGACHLHICTSGSCWARSCRCLPKSGAPGQCQEPWLDRHIHQHEEKRNNNYTTVFICSANFDGACMGLPGRTMHGRRGAPPAARPPHSESCTNRPRCPCRRIGAPALNRALAENRQPLGTCSASRSGRPGHRRSCLAAGPWLAV